MMGSHFCASDFRATASPLFARVVVVGSFLALSTLGVACGPTGSEPDGSPAVEPEAVEPDPFADYGEPLDVPDETWTWVDFPDAHCGNGSETGAAVNPGTSGRVVFYLEGGGACWDAFSCGQGALATNVASGFSGADAAGYINSLGASGIWDRTNSDNPFRDDSFVWVPYCTGDLHAGKVASNTYNVMHVGYDNVEAILQRVVPTFSDSSSVILTGASAGGFGAILNFDHVQQSFQHIPVHLLADSSPPMTSDYIKPALADVQRAAWGLDDTIDPDCANCDDFHNTFLFLADKYADRKIGLITSLEDQTLRFFFGLGYNPINSMTPADYTEGVTDLVGRLNEYDNVRTYVVSGATHVFLYTQPLGNLNSGGTPVTSWIRGFLGEEEAWSNVAP